MIVPDILQVDPSRGHQGDMGQGRPQVPEISNTYRGRKNLYDVGAIAIGREDLGGGKGSGNADRTRLAGILDRRDVQCGGNDKPGARMKGLPGLRGVKHCPRAYQ